MHMLYNSDNFTVVMFEIAAPERSGDAAGAGDGDGAANVRGGFEIVDKFARKDIFIEGAMAATFQAGVEALMENTPNEDDIDEYIGRFTSLMPQPLVLH